MNTKAAPMRPVIPRRRGFAAAIATAASLALLSACSSDGRDPREAEAGAVERSGNGGSDGVATAGSDGAPQGNSASDTSGENPGSFAGTDAGGVPDSSDAANPVINASAPAEGTMGGMPFKLGSGFFRLDGVKGISLILSDMGGACDAATTGHIRAGGVVFQAYNLQGTTPGPLLSSHFDVKYARVASACPVGAAVSPSWVSNFGDALENKTLITITKLSATWAEGTVDITFDDGSTLKGTFAVPACPAALGLICQ
jgi:hypothetical protein